LSGKLTKEETIQLPDMSGSEGTARREVTKLDKISL
jgi:hypothetical protein